MATHMSGKLSHVCVLKHVCTRNAHVPKMSKRKATTVLVRAPKKFNSGGIFNAIRTDAVREQINANRNAAVLIRRQAQLNAMPVQRKTPQEKGYVDLASAAYAFDTTGSITLIATIAQGTSTNQRIGKKAMYASIQVRGVCNSNANTLIADGAWIIVYDRRPTGVLPNITDVLVTSTAISFNNDTNSNRFQIVRRKEFLFISNTTVPTDSTAQQGDDFIKFRRPVVYKAAGTGAIGDIEEGALYAITVGSIAAGTGAATATLAYRVRFTEN